MSHTISGKLNKAAHQHQLQDATMFFIEIGKQVYDRKTSEKTWVNYTAGLYAKGGQVEFYANNLVEGAIVCINCQDLLIKQTRISPTSSLA